MHHLPLLLASRNYLNNGSDSITIAFRTDGANEQGIKLIAAIIPKQVRCLAHISDEELQITVVIDVARGKRTGRGFQCKILLSSIIQLQAIMPFEAPAMHEVFSAGDEQCH